MEIEKAQKTLTITTSASIHLEASDIGCLLDILRHVNLNWLATEEEVRLIRQIRSELA